MEDNNSDNFHNSYSGSQEIQSGNLSDLYHNYRIDWTPTEMIFSLDEVPYHTVEISSDMKEFKRSFYMILNIAVGGSWPGPPNASTSFPQKMFVDYIRVYSKNGFTAPLPPALDIDEETYCGTARVNVLVDDDGEMRGTALVNQDYLLEVKGTVTNKGVLEAGMATGSENIASFKADLSNDGTGAGTWSDQYGCRGTITFEKEK